MSDLEELNAPKPDSLPLPSFLWQIWDQGSDLLVAYGWYLLAILIAMVYYWPSIRSYLDKRYKEQFDREYDAKCKKDPDWLRRRQLEMEAARIKMQEELTAKAALYAEKLKEKEEQKKSELLAASVNRENRLGNGETSNTYSPNKLNSSKKAYRPDYNPLMGSGGSGGYRPPRRGCPGGGCG